MALTLFRFAQSDMLQKASNNQPSLHQGAHGDGVAILQRALMDLGFPMPKSVAKLGRPDGIYGPETFAAVQQFQMSQAMEADGITGRDTLARLEQIFAALDVAEQAKLRAELAAPNPVRPWKVI